MEPKYKLYDVVTIPLENGERRNAIIDYIYPNVVGIPLYAISPDRESDDEYMFHEDELHPVKIYPDYGEVFCKDCKHWRTDNRDGYAFYSETCPIYQWLIKNTIEGEDIEIKDNDDYNDSNRQPPPNCPCFEPKENNENKNI